VLIIDDDPLIRSLLVAALRKDCLVAVATEGAEGFRKSLELIPDVAIVDINMPGWDGLTTLQAFRVHPGLKSVKVIILTADTSQQTVMAAIRCGAHDYLLKNAFSRAEFYRKLNRLVPGTIAEATLHVGGPASHEESSTQVAPAPGASRAGAAERVDEAGSLDHESSVDSPLVASRQASASSSESRLQEMIDGWE